MTEWTKEEDEAFNMIEQNSNLGKQILRDIEGQPYHFSKTWKFLTDTELLLAYGWTDFEAMTITQQTYKDKILSGLRGIENAIRKKQNEL
jgi:hypothetical protein